jgi:hypothetical protein
LTRIDEFPAAISKISCCSCLPWCLNIMKCCNEYITSFTVMISVCLLVLIYWMADSTQGR